MPYKKKTAYRRKPAAKGKKPTRRYKSISSLVKKEIYKAAEVKRNGQNPQVYNFNADNTVMSTPVDLTSQFCTMSNGTADGFRIGELVRTKKATLKLIVTPHDTFNTASILQIFIGYALATKGSPPTAAQLTGIFDDGSVGAPADGSKLSLMRAVNRDAFRIYNYRKIKIGSSTTTGFNNNDFPAYRILNFDMTKHLGLLKYTGSGSEPPNNKHIYMFMNWVDPKTGGFADKAPEVQYYMDFTYTDV